MIAASDVPGLTVLLRRVARRFFADAADVEDVVSDTLERGWSASAEVGEGWLVTTCRNVSLHVVRSRAWRARPAWRAAVARATVGVHEGTSCDPVDALDAAERTAAIATRVARLSPERRRVVDLRFGEDLEYGEIAARLGIPIGTVQSRLARATRDLRAGWSGTDP